MSKTKVIHIRDKNNYPAEKTAYIGRPSKFGNPYPLDNPHDDHKRELVIEKYRRFFHDKINTDPIFRSDILTLRGKILYCYCAPKQCHGDIIADYLNDKLEEND